MATMLQRIIKHGKGDESKESSQYANLELEVEVQYDMYG